MNETGTAAHELVVVSLPINTISAETARYGDEARYGDDVAETPHEAVVRRLADSFNELVKRRGAGQMRAAAELLQHAFDATGSERCVPAGIGHDDETGPGP